MAVGGTRQIVLSLALALSASAAGTMPAASQTRTAPTGDTRFDQFQFRTTEDLERADPSSARPPSDPGRIDDTQRIDQSQSVEPVLAEPAVASPAEADLDFDLFEGPEPTRSVPQTRLGAAEPAATPANERVGQAPGEPRAGALPAARPFQALGPVRSPTFAPASAAERINRAVGDLRPSFPLFAAEPFAADGIRVARFRLFPVFQQEIGVSDNLENDVTQTGGAFSQSILSARLLSDWSRHQLDVAASATYRRNFAGAVEDEPGLAIDGRLRLDLAAETTAVLRGALSFAREDAILADPLVGTAGRPDVLAYSAGVDVTRTLGIVDVSTSADVVREEREVGGAIRLDDFTTASVGLRAGYELSPALQPFVAGSLGRRMFDDEPGIANRDSIISALRGGLAFDFGEKISGELGAGYAWNAPEDDGLPETGAATIDATLAWSPRRGTDILATASTFFDPDRSNLSTSTVYETSLALRHRATARMDLTARLSAAHRERNGTGLTNDQTYAGEAGLTYWINRTLALTALARHERLVSELSAAEYDANSVRIGLRFQR